MKYNMKNLGLVFILSFMGCKNQVSNNENNGGFIQPITECISSDNISPVMPLSLVLESDASKLSSPTVSWQKAEESCEFSHYEVSIGTSIGNDDILSFVNVGDTLSFTQNYLNLDYSVDYFYTVVAVDKAGNRSTKVNSAAWKIFSPKTLSKLVLWLDSAQKSSVLDVEGDNSSDINFSNDVKTWLDLSNSTAIHNFESIGSSLPSWDVRENAIRFNGSQQLMATADHPDINTGIVGQRTIVTVVKTSNDINSRQVIFEEGGTVRGLNIYVENSKLRCGFWNIQNDGDGSQQYTEVSSTISEDTKYVITYLLDYSYFVDRDSADGIIECFVNKNSVGQTSTTSRLHPHSGDIGLGAMNDGSYFLNTGATSGDEYFFKGVLYEYLMYNSSHTIQDINKLNDVLIKKWRLTN